MQHRPTRLDELVVPRAVTLEGCSTAVVLTAVDLDGEFDVHQGDVWMPDSAAQPNWRVGHPPGDSGFLQAAVGDPFANAPRIVDDISHGPAGPDLPPTTSATFKGLLEPGNVGPTQPQRGLQPIRLVLTGQVQAGPRHPGHLDPVLEISITWIDRRAHDVNSGLRIAPLGQRNDHHDRGRRVRNKPEPPRGSLTSNDRFVARPEPACADANSRIINPITHEVHPRQQRIPTAPPNQIVNPGSGETGGDRLVAPDHLVLTSEERIEPENPGERNWLHGCYSTGCRR